ncbi:MAG: TatD family hydrolase [Proteobacteria bacterium]|nr:TatD family hydrolase [Pseudomonadota bacterium]
MLVDSHCHLDFPDFEDEIEDVIARAGAAGVGTMVTIGTETARFDRVLAIASAHENIYCTVGTHPHEAGADGEKDTGPERLAALAADDKVIGIGETGLDYHYDNAPRAAQKKSFHAHIQAARETGLALIVHSRDADDDTIKILGDEFEKGTFGAVMHCFTAGRALADAAVELGFYISFSGIVTFKNAEAVREIAGAVPADRLLVETDAPYLAPVPKRGKRNEPAYLAHTAAYLAELRGMTPEALTEQTTANFFRLFTKAKAPAA